MPLKEKIFASQPLLYWPLDEADDASGYTGTAIPQLGDQFLLTSESNYTVSNTSTGIYMSAGGTSLGYSYIRSKYALASGDFDIYIHTNITAAPATNHWEIALRVIDQASQSDYVTIKRQYDSGTGQNFHWFWHNGSVQNLKSEVNSTTNTRLRLTRTGTTWAAYFWDGTWNAITGGTTSIPSNVTGPVTVEFFGSSSTGFPIVTNEWSNYTITTGTPVTSQLSQDIYVDTWRVCPLGINSPTVGATGLLVNDSDLAVDFTAASSHYFTLGTGKVSEYLSGKSVVSLEAVIQTDLLNSTSRRFFDAKLNGATYGLVLSVNTSNQLEFGARSVSTDAAETLTWAGIATGTPYHVVGIADIGGDYMYLYVNGVLVASGAKTFDNATWTDGAPSARDSIGSGDSGEYWDGKLQHIALYGRALTTQEIYDHYAEARQKYDLPDNSQAVYQSYPEVVKNSAPISYYALTSPPVVVGSYNFNDDIAHGVHSVTGKGIRLPDGSIVIDEAINGDQTTLIMNHHFDGDCDFYYTMNVTTFDAQATPYLAMLLYAEDGRFITAEFTYNSGIQARSYWYNLSAAQNLQTASVSVSGNVGLRISRSGNNYQAYYDTGSGWTAIGTSVSTTGISSSCRPGFYSQSVNATDIEARVTGYGITSADIIVPSDLKDSIKSGNYVLSSNPASADFAWPYGASIQAVSGLTVNDNDTCFQFDGVDDYLNLGADFFSGTFDGVSQCTFEALVYLDAQHKTDQYLFRGYLANGQSALDVAIGTAGFEIYARSQAADSAQSATTTEVLAGYPFHLVVIIDYANDAIKIYKDGVLVKNQSVAFGATTYTAGTPTTDVDVIGQAEDDTRWFDGKLQHIAMYSRALTEDEIINHYQTARVRWDIPALPAPRPYSQLVMDSNPAGYWRLDETSGTTAKDYSSNGNDGTLINTPTLGVTGLLVNSDNKAMTFTAANSESVDLGINTLSPLLNGASQVTLEAIIKDPTQSGTSIVASILLANTLTGASLRITATGWEGGGRSVSTDSFQTVAETVTLTGTHHIVAIFDYANDAIALWRNGTFVGSGSVTFGNTTYTNGTPTTTDDTLASYDNSGVYYNGTMDEVAVYDRALSGPEIKAHAYEAVGRTADPDAATYLYDQMTHRDKPVAWWRLGEAAGIAARDDKGTYIGEHISAPVLNGATPLSVANSANSSIDYDGAADYTTMGNEMSFERTEKMTFEGFLRTSETDAQMSIVSKRLNDASTYRGMQVAMTAGKLRFYLANTSAGSNQLRVETTGTYNDGNWKHFVVTYDGSSSAAGVKWYVNGAEVATSTTHDTLSATTVTTASLDIGTYAGNGTAASFFDGELDDIAIYDYELTPEQVAEHYTAANYTAVTTNWTIAGTLTDETGAAVTSSTLRLFRTDTQTLVDSQTTDGNGDYSFGASPTLSNIEYLLVPEGQVGVKPVSNVIEGYVQFRYGQPQVGVNVWCIKKSDQTVAGVEATNEQGWFQFAGLTAATEYLIAVEYGNAVYPEDV